MTPEQFVYWLQGFLELGKPTSFSKDEVNMIKEHIEKVVKKTPVTFTWNGTYLPITASHLTC